MDFAYFRTVCAKQPFDNFLLTLFLMLNMLTFLWQTLRGCFSPGFLSDKNRPGKMEPRPAWFRRATDGVSDGICETVPWHGPSSMPADAVRSPPFAGDKICFLHKFRHIFLSDMTRCFSVIFCRRKDGFALPGPENPAQQGEILLSGIRCGT